jgi:hypothetical protein
MANRVTDADVKTILDTTVTTTPFIDTAHLIVEEELTVLGTLSESRLTQIELYLAAHLTCSLDPRINEEKIGDATNKYQGEMGSGLKGTLYGQQVILLDITGKLANADKPKAFLECV